MNELTSKKVFMFYEHINARLSEKEVDYDLEPEPLKMGVRQPDGSMVYSK